MAAGNHPYRDDPELGTTPTTTQDILAVIKANWPDGDMIEYHRWYNGVFKAHFYSDKTAYENALRDKRAEILDAQAKRDNAYRRIQTAELQWPPDDRDLGESPTETRSYLLP